jgi:hypothetical protein
MTELGTLLREIFASSFRITSFTGSVGALPVVYPLYDQIAGSGSVVGMATSYGLDDPGIESRWRRDFPHLSRPALVATQPPVRWVSVLSRE